MRCFHLLLNTDHLLAFWRLNFGSKRTILSNILSTSWHSLFLHGSSLLPRQQIKVLDRCSRTSFRFLSYSVPLRGPLPVGPYKQKIKQKWYATLTWLMLIVVVVYNLQDISLWFASITIVTGEGIKKRSSRNLHVLHFIINYASNEAPPTFSFMWSTCRSIVKVPDVEHLLYVVESKRFLWTFITVMLWYATKCAQCSPYVINVI